MHRTVTATAMPTDGDEMKRRNVVSDEAFEEIRRWVHAKRAFEIEFGSSLVLATRLKLNPHTVTAYATAIRRTENLT